MNQYYVKWILSTVCILCALIGPSSQSDEAPDEHLYIRLYGEDRLESGKWRRVRHFRYDTEKLKNISIQAHRKAGLGDDDVIHSAVYDTRSLLFEDADYWAARLRADTIIYSVERAPQNQHFITKGLRLGCVHYLKPDDGDKCLVFKLGRHVCGIEMPTLESMLSFLKRS